MGQRHSQLQLGSLLGTIKLVLSTSSGLEGYGLGVKERTGYTSIFREEEWQTVLQISSLLGALSQTTVVNAAIQNDYDA